MIKRMLDTNICIYLINQQPTEVVHKNRKANFDRLIAAHAIANGVPLVTNNVSDFAMYQDSGLVVENWIRS